MHLLGLKRSPAPRTWNTTSVTCTVNFGSQCSHCPAADCIYLVGCAQVLRCGPPEHEKAVFVGSVADSKTAVNLPASLLAKWIAFSKGDIDLRSQQLPLEQWMKLVAAICMAPPGAVKSLHMSMPHLENDQMVVMSALRSIMAHITHLQYLGLHAFSWRASQINSLIRCFLNASAA